MLSGSGFPGGAFMKGIRFLALVAALISSSASFATNPLAVCMTEKDPATRLRCYDLLAPSLETVREPQSKPAQESEGRDSPQSEWLVNEGTSPVDDRPEIFAYLSSRDGKISIVLRCKDNRTDAFLNPSTYIGRAYKPKVTTRINSEKAISSAWVTSVDGEAAFSPAPIPFIKSLPNSGTLFVRIDNYDGRRSEGTFDLGMMSDVKARIGKVCGWQP